MTIGVVSISGGKDSNATAILAILTLGRENVRLVHADTGHEHPITEDYVRGYLPDALGVPVEIVKADFTKDFARKRAYIEANWENDGVPAERVRQAMDLFERPTGIPFLDLCMMKGRFPSRMAQFCTEELKRLPLDRYMIDLAHTTDDELESWQGVRRDESMNRRRALAGEASDLGWLVRRPIVSWTAIRVFELMAEAGVKPNPLYSQGMRRVGCMPCINCTKDELHAIATRFPAEIDRVREWERLVSDTSKRGYSSLLHMDGASDATNEEAFEASRIDQQIAWAATSRGGKQYDLLRAIPEPECSSKYGLCE